MAKQKAKASTQDHLDIDDIIDDLVLLKTGWVALVMSTTAVNFDLLSEAEQDATIYAYGAFLNSLSFPLEVLVRSKKADITSYFNSLEEAESAQPNPDLKRQIQKYKDFIQSTVQQRTVLDKKFYLIINFSPLEMGIKGALSKKPTQAKGKNEMLAQAKAALAPKRDHIIKQTARLGLTTRQLTTQELVELFYDIYNPAPTGTQRVLLDTESYTTPIVEPALEVPTPAPASAGSQLPESRTAPVGAELSAEELRPVPIPISQMPSQPQPQQQVDQTPAQPVSPPSISQARALADLQAATAKASSALGNQPTAPPTVQGTPAASANQYQVNVNVEENKEA